MEVNFEFNMLPLWRGTQDRPGVSCALPFRIGWHTDGYICQTTTGHVPDQMVAAYADDSYSYITNLPGTSDWANLLGERSLEWVQRSCGSLDGQRILEIGAGNTYIAERLSDEFKILQYVIVDPSIKQISTEKNIRVYREYFEKISWTDEAFNLVLGFGILEHVRNPLQLLFDLNSILRPCSGRAVLCFPDVERQLRAGDLTALIHEHLSYFTQDTVTRLMERAGFEVIDCETKMDSISFIIQAVAAPEITITDGIEMDDVLPTAANQYYRNIQRVEKMIRKALSDGEMVAFHGACNGLNNFLYLTGLYKDFDFQVFDGDWAKAGRYLPTCRKPILHSGDEAYKEFDRIVVASTTFYREIRDYLSEKHRISINRIVPVADVECN